jgi:hypothetical protein
MKSVLFALVLVGCATPEVPVIEKMPLQIIVSCGSLKGIGRLTAVDDSGHGSMAILCGDNI